MPASVEIRGDGTLHLPSGQTVQPEEVMVITQGMLFWHSRGSWEIYSDDEVTPSA